MHINNNITLRQLRAFLAVMEQGSFTRAAAMLNITQSALTNAVKNLEAELGLRLFDRTTRQVEPTTHGRQFATVARRFTEDLERGLDDLRAHADREQGLVVVGATATMITSVLVPTLKVLSERYPGIRVRIIEVLTAEAFERVRGGDMDLAFTTMRDAFDRVCPASPPLAKDKGPLAWDVFRAHRTVGMSEESGIRNILMRHDAGHLAVSRLAYEVSSVSGLTRMVQDGLGIAAVPGLVAQAMAAEGVSRIRLSPSVFRTVSLVTRAGRSPTPAAGALVSAALAASKSRLPATSCPGTDSSRGRRLLGRPAGDHVDLHQRVAGEARHADGGARRQAVRREIGFVDHVHGLVVALELRQEDAARKHVAEVQAQFVQHDDEVVHDAAGLRLDAVRKRRRVVIGVRRHLARELNPAVAFHGVAEGRHRRRRPIEEVEPGSAHRLPPAAGAAPDCTNSSC